MLLAYAKNISVYRVLEHKKGGERMIIAIAKEGNSVSQHFGHCQGFELVTIEDGNVISKETVPNPGHRPGYLPVFLAEKGVKVIIAGGMGGSA